MMREKVSDIVRPAALLLGLIIVGISATGCDVLTGEQKYGEEFRLPVDNRVLVSNDALVTFVEVIGDSRCPKGAVCVWEGDALALFEVKRSGFSPKRFVLHTNDGMTRDTVIDGLSIELVALDPYPEEGRAQRPTEYVATMRLDR